MNDLCKTLRKVIDAIDSGAQRGATGPPLGPSAFDSKSVVRLIECDLIFTIGMCEECLSHKSIVAERQPIVALLINCDKQSIFHETKRVTVALIIMIYPCYGRVSSPISGTLCILSPS